MNKYKIAVIPGDGVGTEVTESAVETLRALERKLGGFRLDFQFYDAGVLNYVRTGTAITEETFAACKAADAILLGAVGIPDEQTGTVTGPNGTEVSGQVTFKLRFDLGLFAGVRPIRSWPGVPSALAGHGEIDFVLVRESTEGLFASQGSGILLNDQVAIDTQVITRDGCERVFQYAFELAKRRGGRIADKKKMVTCTQKANVFRSFAFFKQVFGEVAVRYAGQVEEDYAYIDAITLFLCQHPENFDVVVAENAHGDILSDLCAAFVGGMGMAPSGDIGHEHALFQPAHGTAPTIAGKGVVNPTAAILSGKMMLEWLGDRNRDDALNAAAKALDRCLYNTFSNGVRTADVQGTATTRQFTEEVVSQILSCRP